MYELEIVLPVTLAHKYIQRLQDFKQIGILNVKKRKIRLVLACNKAEKAITEGWSPDIDIKILETGHDHLVPKTCHYYFDLFNRELDSKWYMYVDDDSVTDIDGLLTRLEDYNPDVGIYLSTGMNICPVHHGIMIEHNLLREINAFHLLKGNYYNDYESHIISRTAIKKIADSDLCKLYITKRSRIHDGYVDAFLAHASKIVGVVPFLCPFTYPLHTVLEFSLFGGRFNHLHYICHDERNTEQFFKWKTLFDIKDSPPEAYDKVIGKTYFFYASNSQETPNIVGPIGIVKLDQHFSLKYYKHENEQYWKLIDEKIHFYDKNLKVTSILSPLDNTGDFFAGKFLRDNVDIVHCLKNVKIP